MSVINATPLLAAAGGDYQISRSVRLRSSATASFTRTMSASGTTDTWSIWTKRGKLGAIQALFDYSNASNSSFGIEFTSSDALTFYDYSSAYRMNLVTTQVFRDPSAWYHIVCVLDTTQATAANRAKIYVNGQQVTSFSTATYPTQNASLNIASSLVFGLGVTGTFNSQYLDGYLTEINFIDGQAMTPSSFGETDAVTGVWKPKKYAGTYGTNGFYLNFSDNSAATAAAIGKDSSGNGNNWTPNNISVTAGVTYDSMLDVPTLYADGGNGRGNYAVLNPLSTLAAGATVSGANLNIVGASASAYGSPATMLLTSGKWYFEVTAGSVASRYPVVGVQTELTAFLSSGFPGGYTANGFGYGSDGNKFVNNGAATAFGSTFTSGDVIGVAIDIDAGKVWLAKNNTWQASGDPASGTNAAYSPTAGTPLYPCVGTYNGAGTHSANFGQRPFAYTPPTGFKALNTQNLPDATIKKGNQYFDATTYTGNGSTLAVTNSGSMQPDLVWIKVRSTAGSHVLQDSVRGPTAYLQSNATAAENTNTANDWFRSFNSNGFTVAGSTTGGTATTEWDSNGNTFVGWQWKESASAGFDIVTYSGTGAAQTVAHGLGVAPKMLIVKSRNGTGKSWNVWHTAFAATDYIYLEQTAAKATDATKWNSTAPSSTVFSLGSAGGTNASGENFVAYLFSEVAGFSKFGSYTGNGSADGPFIFLGFRPRFVMIKRTDAVEGWYIYDTARDTFNVLQNELRADSSAAESAFASRDFLSNGFKIRTANGSVNSSGGTYIFMALAENPFKTSLAR